MLRKPLLHLFSDGNDDIQFEWKEYLICVERDSLPGDDAQEKPVLQGVHAIQSDQPVRQVKKKEEGGLLKPRVIGSLSFLDSIDSALSILSGVSSVSSFSSDDEFIVPKSTSCIDRLASAGNPSTVSEGESFMAKRGKSLPLNHCDSLASKSSAASAPVSEFSLPCFVSIQQKDDSFFSLHAFPPASSLSEYQTQLCTVAQAVIRSTLFSTSSQYESSSFL